MRGYFAYELHKHMQTDSSIWVVTGGMGFGMLDRIRDDFPNRFINTGAAETTMMGIGCGLALGGKKPFVYTITSFLLFRPFETIRNYVHHESLPVRLIGSGRDKDYLYDGISHWSEEAKDLLKLFPNIRSFWPQTKEEIPSIVETLVKNNNPQFLSLRR